MKDADNPTTLPGQVSHPERAPQRHLQTTTCSCRYVTLGPPLPYLALPLTQALVVWSVCTVLTGTPAEVSVPAVTTLPTTRHNTDNTLLLLFADACIAPALLAGLCEVDELMIALGCRFALDIFTIAQQDRRPPVPVPLPRDPGFARWF